ncbi:unnamed protein product [Paramecium sonneborni]|uniref:Uncharacterized protein n=1 Tax=Paramecium sonneborni TaxID=65129 RepID=A0A8S1RTI8_9CILI|nr:unnamed protein product [Paramecium sonneborni]
MIKNIKIPQIHQIICMKVQTKIPKNKIFLIQKELICYNIQQKLQEMNTQELPQQIENRGGFINEILNLIYIDNKFLNITKILKRVIRKITSRVQQVKEIIRYSIKILKQQPEPFQYIVNQMMNKNELQEYISNAINMIVQDFKLQKFKVEEEDQIKNLQKPDMILDQFKECMGDSEIHQLLGEIESTMADGMNQLGLGGIDSIPENFENFT